MEEGSDNHLQFGYYSGGNEIESSIGGYIFILMFVIIYRLDKDIYHR